MAGENFEQRFTAQATIKSFKAGKTSLLDCLENLEKVVLRCVRLTAVTFTAVKNTQKNYMETNMIHPQY